MDTRLDSSSSWSWSSRPKPMGLRQTNKSLAHFALCSILLMIASISFINTADIDSDINNQLEPQQVSPSPTTASSADDSVTRQYFKVNSLTGSKKTAPKEFKQNYKTHNLKVDRKQKNSLGEHQQLNSSMLNDDNDKVSGQKQTGSISSSALKKLLNQSLSKSSTSVNGSSLNGPKSSNFKFVFIQRATAAPKWATTTTVSGHKMSEQQQISMEPKLNISSADSSRSSLAASVSKQLANSLMNSAVGLVAKNLSSVPSLSSIASQIAAAAATATATATAPTNDNRPGIDYSLLSSRRASKGTPTSSSPTASGSIISPIDLMDKQATDSSKVDDNNDNKKAAKTSTRVKSYKPSKIYNLPVKFVSNGQPNGHVVFHTLKEHFATIKRLQSAISSTGVGLSAGGSIKTGGGGGGTKNRKKPNGHQKNRYKGNSKLIYLPLRYLSNGRPGNKVSYIVGTKSSS